MPVRELTDTFCRSAKPIDGKQTDYFDTNTKGLCLSASIGGTRTWYLHYTRQGDGKRRRIKLGHYPDLKLAKARTKASAQRAAVVDGSDPVAVKQARAASATVSDLVENYIVRKAAGKRSADEIARRLRKNVSPAIGAMKLADLHRRDVTRCIDAVVDRGATIEANRVFEDVRAMIRWARGRGDLDSNIIEGMPRPTETTERDRALDADDIRTVWKALPDATMQESTRDVLRLCLITGQRVGEVSGMTLDELDLDSALWIIPAERSKNKTRHEVPLSDMSMALIRARMTAAGTLAKRKGRDASRFIFPAPGGRASVSGAAVAKAVKRQEKRAGVVMGVESFTPHDLRRTVASGMGDIGISPFVIGHVLNHRSITRSTITSRIYNKYDYHREKREALTLWADRLAAIIEGRGKVVPLRQADQ